jgi:hypothetical protein
VLDWELETVLLFVIKQNLGRGKRKRKEEKDTYPATYSKKWQHCWGSASGSKSSWLASVGP